MRRRCFVVAVAAGLLVSSPNIAYAKAPVWSVTPSPNPAGATKSELLSVSCSSTTFCVAVGDSTNDHAQTSVERWNGGSWAIMHSLDPTGVSADMLAGVSCPASSNCFAVGSSTIFGIGATLIEHWNGNRWAIMSSPSPGARFGTRIELHTVSCPSTDSCFAVGSAGDGLIEHWNGSHWTVMTGANPPGVNGVDLLGVSCPSPRDCFAVGTYADPLTALATQPLVEHWNGRGGWSITTIAPSFGRYAQLSGVACPSTTSCFAVGSYSGAPVSGIFGSFVEQWNGRGSWTVASTRLSSGLAAVSCASPTNCFAVSDETSSIEHWDGNSWSVVTMNRPPVEVALNAVSCRSPISCFAAGRTRNDATLIERFV